MDAKTKNKIEELEKRFPNNFFKRTFGWTLKQPKSSIFLPENFKITEDESAIKIHFGSRKTIEIEIYENEISNIYTHL